MPASEAAEFHFSAMPARHALHFGPYPAILSLVNPSFGAPGLKTADRTLMSHSSRGQALIEARVFEMVARAEGRRIAGKSVPRGDRTGDSQTLSSGI